MTVFRLTASPCQLCSAGPQFRGVHGDGWEGGFGVGRSSRDGLKVLEMVLVKRALGVSNRRQMCLCLGLKAAVRLVTRQTRRPAPFEWNGGPMWGEARLVATTGGERGRCETEALVQSADVSRSKKNRRGSVLVMSGYKTCREVRTREGRQARSGRVGSDRRQRMPKESCRVIH